MISDCKSAKHTLPLIGSNILVTRPVDRAEALCDMIVANGGCPIKMPTVEITPIEHNANNLRIFANLAEYNWIIFVSIHAVIYSLSMYREEPRIPTHVKVAAIGKSTADVLENNQIRVDLLPKEQFNSEALLASADLQGIAGQNILIVRGKGGRSLLAAELSERGANVEYAEVYRRNRAQVNVDPIIKLWRQQGMHAVIVTSAEILQNLIAILGSDGLDLLRTTPLIVPSERIAQKAKKSGLEKVILAASTTNWALLAATVKIGQNSGC